jgi:hypothetical protein
MAAREQDGLQSGSGIKRAWDDERTLPAKGSAWHTASLPPIDAAPHRSTQVPRVLESGPTLQSLYGRDFSENETKRPRYEQNEYHSQPSPRGHAEVNSYAFQSQQNRESISPPSSPLVFTVGE